MAVRKTTLCRYRSGVSRMVIAWNRKQINQGLTKGKQYRKERQ